MDTFSWICSYSAGLSPSEMESQYKHIGADPKKTNEQLHLLWVSVGDEDFMFKGNVEFMDYLKSRNVNYKSLITRGGHTWMNVKTYVAETAQLLFQ